MSLLDTVKTGTEEKPRRILEYGTPGIGKSTWAAQAPGVIFLQTEDGLGEIDCAKFPLCTDFKSVLEILETLYNEKHDYQTIAIDSLDWLERLIHANFCKNNHIRELQHIGELDYSKGYELCLVQWRQVLDRLAALHEHKNMMIILVSHSRIEKFNNPHEDSYDRYVPRLHKWASVIVQEWVDEILFAYYDMETTNDDETFGKARTRGTGQGKRILYTQERPAHIAKNRLNMPPQIDFLWSAYEKYINKKK